MLEGEIIGVMVNHCKKTTKKQIHNLYGKKNSSSVNFGRNFLFSLNLYLETKMLNSLSHILII